MTEKKANKLGYFIITRPIGFGLKKVVNNEVFYSGQSSGWAKELVEGIPHIPLRDYFTTKKQALGRVSLEVNKPKQ